MTDRNPIPLNPQTMKITHALSLLDDMRTVFALAMRDGVSDEEIVRFLRIIISLDAARQ